jgi:hypothetical protein
MISELFEPMILQVQGFFKDMNAQCSVNNIGQACVTSDDRFELVLKNDYKVLK